MYYVYKITLNNSLYIGCTNNLQRRKDQHNENARKLKSKFGAFLNQNNIILQKSDLEIIRSFEDRKEALNYERYITLEYAKQGISLLNDNYTNECTRKGKNIGNTAKDYVVIDILTHSYTIVHDLRQYAVNSKLFSYKSIQDTLKKVHICKNRYKAFYLKDWECIEDKDYYLSGKFLEDINIKNKISAVNKTSKRYKVLTPVGEIIEVKNLDKYAREVGVSSGTLHSTYKSGKTVRGYRVIERLN